MFKDLKIRIKILVILISVAIIAVSICGLFGYDIARKALEEESFNKLTAVREMTAHRVEDYFQQITDQMRTLSEDRMIIDATNEFKAGFKEIDTELGIMGSELAEIDIKLGRYYLNEFLFRLKPNLDLKTESPALSGYMPKQKNTRILQNLYIANNPNDTGSKHLMDSAGDGSKYSTTHAKYHPIILSFLEKFGYYDIFIVDHETGHIVYTVFKEVDYGTSLLTGPYSKTNFADAFRSARNSDDKDFVKLVDFEPYHPSYNAYASFIASPIFDGDEKIGVLLFQMPVERINNIMTNNHDWAEVGLGVSGETYIVGSDYKIRNQSRFLIEDKVNYFCMIKKIGVPPKTIERIKKLNSTIGLQEVKTEGTKAALRGETDTRIFPDYRGVSVLSSYRPLDIIDADWAIMSEIDESEAFSSVKTLRNSIFLIFVILIAGIIIIAIYFSNTITRPLQIFTRYSDEFSKHDFSSESCFFSQENLDAILERGDEVGGLAKAFKHMETELCESVENLKITTSSKERMESELNIGRDIQMSMLPLIFPAFPDHKEFDVYAVLEPAREVGGDFYDFFFIDENRFCFCVGDVSGKGVPSALFMAVTKTLIKSRASNDPSTASIMTHVNDEISEDNPASMFITVFIAIMDIKTGEMVYTNAGHNPPYIIRKDCSVEYMTDRHGPVIGAVPGLAYKESRVTLYHGDSIFMYTDGITEAKDERNNLYSDKRLADLLSSQECSTLKALVEIVMQSVDQFMGKADQFDDITILAVQNSGSTESAIRNSMEIKIKNQYKEMGKVITQFNDFAEKNEIATDVSRKIKIVFDELLNNIISYAYSDKEGHEIVVRVELYGDRLTIVITDDGIPFNPFGLDAPDTDLALEHREEGGLGIHLVQNMMDKVTYQRKIDENSVTLLKILK